MPVDFKALLSPSARARMEHGEREAARIHGLPDRMLAREILRLGQRARAMLVEAGHHGFGNPLEQGYGNRLLWDAVPDLAHRLGERCIEPNERRDADAIGLQGQDLRDHVSALLKNCEVGHLLGYRRDEATANACYMLGRPPYHGNPVAIALDRLAPPDETSDDWCARSMSEVGRSRFGDDDKTTAWTPAFALRHTGRTARAA